HGTASDFQTSLLQSLNIVVVDFVAMTVTLNNYFLAIAVVRSGARLQSALLGTQTHSAAQIGVFVALLDGTIGSHPLADQRDHRVCALRFELGAVRIAQTRLVAGVFNHRYLHTQADAQIRNLVLACVLHSEDLAFHTAVTKTTRNQDRVYTFQQMGAMHLDVA